MGYGVYGYGAYGGYGQSDAQIAPTPKGPSVRTDNTGPGASGPEEDSVPPQRNRSMPSTKVQFLANEIEELESKCSQLEGRNNWLTRRLLTRQRRFIERTMLSNHRQRVRQCFEAWREAMNELRLEQHLDEQTASLDQCQ